MGRSTYAWMAFVASLITACSAEEISDSILPDGIRNDLNTINEAVIVRDVDLILASGGEIANEINTPGVLELLQFLPDGAYVNRQLAAVKWITIKGLDEEPDRTTYTVEYQYEYTEGWAYVAMRVVEEDGATALRNLQIVRLPESLDETNAFTFDGKSFLNYVIFAVAIATPVFILVTFITCASTPKLRRKKRWLIFILFGISILTLNWTTGALNGPTSLFGFKVLGLKFLGASYTMTSMLAPVMITVTIPLGAILFWIFRQRGTLALINEGEMERIEDETALPAKSPDDNEVER